MGPFGLLFLCLLNSLLPTPVLLIVVAKRVRYKLFYSHPTHFISHSKDLNTTIYLLTPYSLLPTPYSLLPTPYSLLLTPYSLLPTPYSLLPTPYSLFLTPYSLLLTPYSLLPTP